MIEIKQDVSTREIRVFGLLWLAFLGGLGGLAIWKPEGLIGAATILGVAWIGSMLFNSSVSRGRQLLGLILPVAFALIGGSVRAGVDPWNVATVAWAVGAAGALGIWAVPSSFGRGLYYGWMFAALPVGWTISHVVLAAVFYVVMTPIGIVMRLAGHDPMRRRLDRAAQSYWIERANDPDARRAFRQF